MKYATQTKHSKPTLYEVMGEIPPGVRHHRRRPAGKLVR